MYCDKDMTMQYSNLHNIKHQNKAPCKNDLAKNISLDLRNNNNCETVVKDKDFIINMI